MANLDYADPSQQDWQAQVRQQIMLQQQQTADPMATSTPAPEPDTTSPDFAQTVHTQQFAAPPGAGAGGYPTAQAPAPEPAPAAPPAIGAPDTPAPGNDANQVYGWYSTFLGRSATPGEVNAWLGSGLSLGDIQNRIANSPEAQAYAKAKAAPTPTPAPTPAPTAAAPTTPAPPQGVYGLSNGYAVPPSANASDPNQAWKNSIRQIIMNRLTTDQQPIDENAPSISAAVNAAKDQYTRQNDAERTALAERLYAQGSGLNTNAVTQQIQQSNERTGTGLSTLKAQLLYSAYKDRMTELNHLLDLATQAGDTESAQQIQVTLGNLQAALAREGLGVNLAEFGASLDQNAALAGLNG